MRRLPLLAAATLVAAPTLPRALAAQEAPSVALLAPAPGTVAGLSAPIDTAGRYYACHVPSSGTMYRIRAAGTPAGCASGHVEIWWSKNGLSFPFMPPDASSLGALMSVGNTGTSANSHGASFKSKVAAGVRGSSQSGAGVHGVATTDAGVAVRAEAYGQNTPALDIVRGGIRVTGAGADTPTAAFILTANSCGKAKYIDNPLSNGRPGAMIFATARGSSTDGQLVSASVSYDAGAGKWMLKTNNQWGGGVLKSLCGLIDVNVLIINR